MDSGDAKWQYTGADLSEKSATASKDTGSINWSASEYIAHEKTQAWIFLVLGGSIIISIILYVLYGDILTSVAIFTAGSCATFVGMRQPQAVEYELTSSGLKAGSIFHNFSEFKSFSIVEEGAIDSIWLKRLARFKPPVVIYFAPEDEDKIIEVLSDFLPHEQRQLDAIDRFSKRIRF